MACVRNLWNDRSANVSGGERAGDFLFALGHSQCPGLQAFPQWLEYHLLRGVQHFLVYTTSDMSPALQEIYQPFVDAGVITRVYYDVALEKCWYEGTTNAQQNLLLNDCLHRSKGRILE